MTQREIYKDQMRRLGITNPRLGAMLYITPSTVSKWLKDDKTFAKHADAMNKALAAIIAEEATAEESTDVEQDHDQAPDQSTKEIGMVALPTPDAPDPDDDRLPWESDDEEPDLTLERAIRRNVAMPMLDNLKEVRGNVRDMNVLVGSALTFGLLSGNEYADLMHAIDAASSGMDQAQAILEEMMK